MRIDALSKKEIRGAWEYRKQQYITTWGVDYKNDPIKPRSLGEIVRTSGHKNHFKEIMKIILEIWINVHSQ